MAVNLTALTDLLSAIASATPEFVDIAVMGIIIGVVIAVGAWVRKLLNKTLD